MNRLPDADGTRWIDSSEISDHHIALLVIGGVAAARKAPQLYARLVRQERDRRGTATA